MIRASKLLEIGAWMAVANVLYAGGKHILFGEPSPFLLDATYWEAGTLFIVWTVCRREHA